MGRSHAVPIRDRQGGDDLREEEERAITGQGPRREETRTLISEILSLSSVLRAVNRDARSLFDITIGQAHIGQLQRGQ